MAIETFLPLQVYLIVKGDPRRLLRHIYVLVKCSIRVVALLLDRCAEFHQLLGDWLVSRLQHANEASWLAEYDGGRTNLRAGEVLVMFGEERNRPPSFPSAASAVILLVARKLGDKDIPADTMNIVFGRQGECDINDQPHRRDIKPARGDVRGHQDRNFAGLERMQAGRPLRLRQIPVDPRDIKAPAPEVHLHAHRLLLVQTEY